MAIYYFERFFNQPLRPQPLKCYLLNLELINKWVTSHPQFREILKKGDVLCLNKERYRNSDVYYYNGEEFEPLSFENSSSGDLPVTCKCSEFVGVLNSFPNTGVIVEFSPMEREEIISKMRKFPHYEKQEYLNLLDENFEIIEEDEDFEIYYLIREESFTFNDGCDEEEMESEYTISSSSEKDLHFSIIGENRLVFVIDRGDDINSMIRDAKSFYIRRFEEIEFGTGIEEFSLLIGDLSMSKAISVVEDNGSYRSTKFDFKVEIIQEWSDDGSEGDESGSEEEESESIRGSTSYEEESEDDEGEESNDDEGEDR